MRTFTKLSVLAACIFGVGAFTDSARGGGVSDLNRGLQLVGFTYLGDDNVLTGGREFLATNTFSGNAIDFGPWSLTLQGPLSTGFSVANRPFQSFDFTFGTSASGSNAASPLTYSLDFNLGDQTGSISGSLLLDGAASVDRLGFYTVRFDASSRNTLAGTSVNTGEFDFDLGPVDIAGNIYVDAIALLTDPIFDAANVVNPFDSLTARNQIQAIVDAQTSDLLDLLENGVTPGDGIAQREITLTLSPNVTNGVATEPSLTGGSIVPEPTVLLLMLAGLPFVARRRR